jgi:hypothetical protein
MARLLLVLLSLLLCSHALGQSKELTRLLRALERGDVDAVVPLERGHPLQAVEPLGRALSQRDPRMRIAAASALWTLAETRSYHPRIENEAGAALQGALSDSDALVAMYAASGLQALGRPPESLLEARRRALQAEGPVLARFLAARGLIGFESGAVLAPPLHDYLRATAPAENIGLTSSVRATSNLKLAHSAIERLLEADAPGAIAALLPELNSADPAVPSILVLLDTKRDLIPDWVDHLVVQVDSANPNAQERAWELLGEQREATQAARWVGVAAAHLPTSPHAMTILNSLTDQAGASPDAYAALADHALDLTRPEAERRRALDAIEAATSEHQSRADAASRSAARDHGLRVVAAVLADAAAPRDLARVARYAMRSIEPDATRRAAWLTDVLLATQDLTQQQALLEMLGQIGEPARPSLDRLLPFADSPNAELRAVAFSSLTSIDPAWQAREARASRPLPPVQQAVRRPRNPRPCRSRRTRGRRPRAAAAATSRTSTPRSARATWPRFAPSSMRDCRLTLRRRSRPSWTSRSRPCRPWSTTATTPRWWMPTPCSRWPPCCSSAARIRD